MTNEELKSMAAEVAAELQSTTSSVPAATGGGSRQRGLPEPLRERFIRVRTALFQRAQALDHARVIELNRVAEHVHQQRARDGIAAAAAQALQSDLQRVEAELDIFIDQLPFVRLFGARIHLQERLERQRTELLHSAAAQVFLRQIVGEHQARNLGADAVDLPSDPSLPSKQRDSLDVARHLSLVPEHRMPM